METGYRQRGCNCKWTDIDDNRGVAGRGDGGVKEKGGGGVTRQSDEKVKLTINLSYLK